MRVSDEKNKKKALWRDSDRDRDQQGQPTNLKHRGSDSDKPPCCFPLLAEESLRARAG